MQGLGLNLRQSNHMEWLSSVCRTREFLNLHEHGFDVAGIFWGLWLFPLGCWCTGRVFFRASWGSC